ncbi:MAG TPA: sugar phosphate isomerase/epimerase family protein [Dongiaceae bacterium]|nr:sugar phosphate isomerase/epimerase family protein [Dongiaceae bacterium]
MKFAVNALIWTTEFDHHSFSLLPKIREHGFDGFEVPVFAPAKVDARAIRKELDANELACRVCVILPPGLSPIDGDESIRQRTRQHLADCVKLTADLGSDLMAGPVYAPVGYLPGRRRTDNEWKWAVECFQSLAPVLEQNSIHLGLEPLNRFETYFLNTAADAVSLCNEINHPRIGVLLDTFHTNIEEKNVADAFRLAGSRLKHIHACENDRGIPGTGHVDFPGIAAALREMNYDGWITIESFGYTHKELAAAAAIWRDLAPTPESIAFDGIRLLRRFFNS